MAMGCCWKVSDSLSVSMLMDECGVDTKRSHQSFPLTNANSSSKISDIAHCGPVVKHHNHILNLEAFNNEYTGETV